MTSTVGLVFAVSSTIPQLESTPGGDQRLGAQFGSFWPFEKKPRLTEAK
jgi:hypothetical protein